MFVKKSPKANLESNRLPLFFIGILFAASVILTAFEWKTFNPVETDYLGSIDIGELPPEPIFTVTTINKPLPPPPPPKPMDHINLVDDIPSFDSIDDLAFPDFDDPVIPQDIERIIEEDDLIGVLEGFVVDEVPSFVGGEEAMMNYLYHAISYPEAARKVRIQGTVWIEFVVAKDGSIRDITVLRGIGGGCEEIAVKAIEQMPRWNPGKQKGIAVDVRFRLPVVFTLRN